MFERVKTWIAQRGGGKSPLQQNMEKALQMKREAGPQTHIPENRTSHTGGVQESQTDYNDTDLKAEGVHTENLGRSHGVRQGDQGKSK